MNGEYIWLSGIEPCVYGKNKGATFNEFCKNTILRNKIETNTIHATQKPLSLFSKLVDVSSKKNDLVLDCFSGSGTTAIACHRLNRRFICIEKDKDYWEASVKRLKNEQSQLTLDLF